MCARGQGAQLVDGMMGHRVGHVVLDLEATQPRIVCHEIETALIEPLPQIWPSFCVQKQETGCVLPTKEASSIRQHTSASAKKPQHAEASFVLPTKEASLYAGSNKSF